MWDRYYWHAAHQSFRGQQRAPGGPYRGMRPGSRYSYYRRKPFVGILLFILIVIFVSESWRFLLPIAIVVGLVLLWLRLRSDLSGSGSAGSRNYQQSSQYYQPPQQPYGPGYQSPTSQPGAPPPYQPYGQGYQASQTGYQQGAQPYQANPSRSTAEQYEEPLAQYPQEMPPMA